MEAPHDKRELKRIHVVGDKIEVYSMGDQCEVKGVEEPWIRIIILRTT